MLVRIYRTISTLSLCTLETSRGGPAPGSLRAVPICCGPAALFQVVGKGFPFFRVGLLNVHAWPRAIFYPAKGFGILFKDSHNFKVQALEMSFILCSVLDRLLFSFGPALPCRLRVLGHGRRVAFFLDLTLGDRSASRYRWNQTEGGLGTCYQPS